MKIWIVLQQLVVSGAYPYLSTEMVAYRTKDEAKEAAIEWMHKEPSGTYSTHECRIGGDAANSEDTP